MSSLLILIGGFVFATTSYRSATRSCVWACAHDERDDVSITRRWHSLSHAAMRSTLMLWEGENLMKFLSEIYLIFKRKFDPFLGSSQALILTSSRARFFSIFFQLFFRKISENFTKNSWKISSKKWPPRAYTPGRPPFSYKISRSLFLYINPYDTCEFLKKSEKSALFGIPFHENFSLDENFGLNPVWKKLWLGGESYKWAKKGLHRAFFIEICTLRWTNGLWLRLFFRPTGSIFLTSQNFAKIFCHFFLKISWFFWQKNAPQGEVFLMIFWSLSEAIFWAIFWVIFWVIFWRIFREFFREFFRKFYVRYHPWWAPLPPPTRDVMSEKKRESLFYARASVGALA